MKFQHQNQPDLQLDRVMVTLLFDIKRNLPANQHLELEVTSCNIGETLIKLHNTSDNYNIKYLTHAFLSRAGHHWLKEIQ